MRPLALLAAAALAAAGCGSPCQELGERICNCFPAGAGRDNCKRRVQNTLSTEKPGPTEADQAFCESRLETCPDPQDDPSVCDRLRTAQGKVDCGFAFAPEAPP